MRRSAQILRQTLAVLRGRLAQSGTTLRETVSVVLMAAGVMTTLSLASFSPQDLSLNAARGQNALAHTHNWIGPMGAVWADVCLQVLGLLSWGLALSLMVMGARRLVGKTVVVEGRHVSAFALMALSLGTLLELLLIGTKTSYPLGGAFGAVMARVLRAAFAPTGAALIAATGALVALALALGGTLTQLARRFGARVSNQTRQWAGLQRLTAAAPKSSELEKVRGPGLLRLQWGRFRRARRQSVGALLPAAHAALADEPPSQLPEHPADAVAPKEGSAAPKPASVMSQEVDAEPPSVNEEQAFDDAASQLASPAEQTAPLQAITTNEKLARETAELQQAESQETPDAVAAQPETTKAQEALAAELPPLPGWAISAPTQDALEQEAAWQEQQAALQSSLGESEPQVDGSEHESDAQMLSSPSEQAQWHHEPTAVLHRLADEEADAGVESDTDDLEETAAEVSRHDEDQAHAALMAQQQERERQAAELEAQEEAELRAMYAAEEAEAALEQEQRLEQSQSEDVGLTAEASVAASEEQEPSIFATEVTDATNDKTTQDSPIVAQDEQAAPTPVQTASVAETLEDLTPDLVAAAATSSAEQAGLGAPHLLGMATSPHATRDDADAESAEVYHAEEQSHGDAEAVEERGFESENASALSFDSEQSLDGIEGVAQTADQSDEDDFRQDTDASVDEFNQIEVQGEEDFGQDVAPDLAALDEDIAPPLMEVEAPLQSMDAPDDSRFVEAHDEKISDEEEPLVSPAAPLLAEADALAEGHYKGQLEGDFLSVDKSEAAPAEALAWDTAREVAGSAMHVTGQVLVSEQQQQEAVAPYTLPPVDLLSYEVVQHAPVDSEQLRANAARLTKTLADYGIEGHVREIRPGPVVTLYEYVPAPGIKLSKIVSLADDLAMSMEALRVRIVAPIPGKGAVGIEIPNEERETVFLREIVSSHAFGHAASPLTMALGKDIEGAPYVADLARMPHLLVAGATGAGKSVSINAMIMSVLYKASPQEVRMIMVDPKMLELSVYEGIPHLLLPVVTDPKKAALALKWAVAEMERRYELLSEVGVRSIDSYNKRVRAGRAQGEPVTIAGSDPDGIRHACEPLPYLLVIVDELADLMMVASREVEGSIMRLAQMARAAGIHLVLATQRPSVDVLTGVIKANFPTRIAFQVASRHDSRTIIDANGAEHLLGRGDMLYLAGGAGGLLRVHGCYVSEEDIDRCVAFAKSQGQPSYDESILSEALDDDQTSDLEDDFKDEMYDQGVAVVAQTQQASISLIQRRLRIGYNRAARMVERMESEGVVGPADGAKPREVFISPS